MAVERDAATAHLGDKLQRLAQLLMAAALADDRRVPDRVTWRQVCVIEL